MADRRSGRDEFEEGIKRRAQADKLFQQDEEQNAAFRSQAEQYKKDKGSMEGAFGSPDPEQVRRVKMQSIRKAMSSDKTDESSPIGQLFKSIKDKFGSK